MNFKYSSDEGISAKIERAEIHLNDVSSQLKQFKAGDPFKLAKRRDSANRPIYYVQRVVDPPKSMAAAVGDVIQTLRASLDYLAYALVRKGIDRVASPLTHVYFPIANTKTEYEKIKIRRTKGIKAAALLSIDAHMPYQSGNKTLWLIHSLNLVDKHRLLLTVGSSFAALNLGNVLMNDMQTSFPDRPFPKIDYFVSTNERHILIQEGADLYIGGPDDDFVDMQFQFDIVFGDPEAEGLPILGTLSAMIDAVHEISSDLDRHL